jgi:hypothetical protein
MISCEMWLAVISATACGVRILTPASSPFPNSIWAKRA